MEHLILDCSEIKEEFNCFFVKTTSVEVEDCYKNMINNSLEDKQAVYIGSISFLRTYNKEKLIELHTEKTKNWENWCNDVLLFYVSRFILYGDSIPIIKME